MKKLKLYALPLLCLAGIGAYFTLSGQPEPLPPVTSTSAPIEGLHYELLDYQEPELFKGKVTEFFWYSCGHCYNMEKHLATEEMKLATSKWDFEQVHAPYEKKHRESLWKDFNVFALLKDKGLEGTVGKEYMEKIHEDNFDRSKVGEFLQAKGLSSEDVKVIETGNKITKQEFNKYIKLYTQEKIKGVPTFVVGGKYVVRDYENLKEVIDYLLTK